MSFEDDLNAPVAKDTADVDVILNDQLYTLRFTALDGLVWAAECDKYPMRPDVAFDRVYGYNIRSLTVGAAPLSGARVDGDTTVPLSEQNWRELFKRIDGAAFKRVTDAIWALNEYNPAQAVEAAKKALAGLGKTSASRSSSVSPRAASGAGSRKK